MRAAVYDTYGTADALSIAEISRPAAGPAEVLVRVHCTAINRGDWYWLLGVPYVFRPVVGLRKPKHHVLGLAIAGEVVEVGAEVEGMTVGDLVVGEVPRGGFAEYVSVEPDAMARIADGVSFAQASTLPVTGTTGLEAVQVAEVAEGTRVLIVGGSGGVGTFAVQLAKHMGGEVTAVCGPAHTDRVGSLGADRVIDYTKEEVTDGDDRFDAIIDIAGTHRISRLRRVLTPDGILVLTSGTGGNWLGPIPRMLRAVGQTMFSRQKLRIFSNESAVEDLDLLGALVADGRLRPVVQSEFPLESIRSAMAGYGSGHSGGKVVIDMGRDGTT